jgi:hypothetical protein
MFMKNYLFVGFLFSAIMFCACGNGSSSAPVSTDTVKNAVPTAIDSAANNGVLPPSGAAGNANNSSLADTSYNAKAKAKDSLKK